MELTGSQIVMECLLEQGVDTVFGYPGGAILNIYDALYEYSDKIRHVLTSHEQGAAHAADGYARSTGRVGVCLATSGPGATNLVTGLATAYMDSIPMVAITANVSNSVLGRDSFQEVDITGVAMPITKYSMIVRDVRGLAPAIRRAFRLARSGRAGPVLLDLTKDVTASRTKFWPVGSEPPSHGAEPPDMADVRAAAGMIRSAKKPFIFAGGGVVSSNASRELAEFARRIDAPVSCSLMAQGVFDQDNPSYTGMLGMHGTKTTNYAVMECDLLIAIGVRFSDRCIGDAKTFAKNAKILQIDIDQAEINKNIKVDACVIGDAGDILKRLTDATPVLEHPDWMAHIRDMKQRYPLEYPKDRLTGPYVVEKLSELTGGDAIIVTDVGQHQMWAAQYYKYRKPRRFISSGGLGTMGYGLGAAVGAQVANPDRRVISITGDGSFRMNMNELATVTRNDLPITIIIMNNSVLGMVRQWQTLFYGGRYSNTVLNDKVDYVELARAMGADGIRVTKKEEIVGTLEKALASDRATVIDCQIDCDDMVFPMVAPGKPISDIFTQKDMEEETK